MRYIKKRDIFIKENLIKDDTLSILADHSDKQPNDVKVTLKKLDGVRKSGNVRVRFAPSPTGPLHCGGIRTCLYNYLFAKKNDGKLILRIEDTDSDRFVPGAENYIQEAFDWVGIEFDESPSKGGPYGPYRQSERKDIYLKYVKKLVDSGKAYYSFDTMEDLKEARNNFENFSYNYITRNNMKNSLTLTNDEVEKLLVQNNDWVVRIKYPESPTDIIVDDIIRGKITVNTSTLDDKVIWKKKDELPTYHLANIVDDHLMKITHVIRGEEWLPSAPLHVYLYDCFGWDHPKFAHLPLILGPNGKLSKRDGDKYGFPVFPLDWQDPNDPSKKSMGYREFGWSPEAVINFLAFIGWNPGTEKEIYTMEELIVDFDLSRVNKAGGKFNKDKAEWFNKQHMKRKEGKLDQEKVEDVKIDPLQRKLQIQKELKTANNAISSIEAKLNNSKFLSRAPENVIASETKRLEENRIKVRNLEDELNNL